MAKSKSKATTDTKKTKAKTAENEKSGRNG
jgi:hypothetical protein